MGEGAREEVREGELRVGEGDWGPVEGEVELEEESRGLGERVLEGLEGGTVLEGECARVEGATEGEEGSIEGEGARVEGTTEGEGDSIEGEGSRGEGGMTEGEGDG